MLLKGIHSVYDDTESLFKIWDLMPLELKQLESSEVFKLKIKKWISFESFWRLCRTYMQQFGFLWTSKADHDHCCYHFSHLRCLYDNIYEYICWFFNFYFVYLMIYFCFFLRYFHVYPADALAIILSISAFVFLSLAFLFCLGVTLISTTNWDFVSNV